MTKDVKYEELVWESITKSDKGNDEPQSKAGK